MKLTIYTDMPKVEKITTLKLEHTVYGISLVVVNEEGNTIPGGIILDVTGAGKIILRDGVDPDLGFDLDAGGQVKHN